MTQVKIIQYSKDANRTTYTVIVGCIDIAHIWAPDKRSSRSDFMVRLHFNQERGKVDFSKDKHFKTFYECKEYIHTEFSKCIKRLSIYYGHTKNK